MASTQSAHNGLPSSPVKHESTSHETTQPGPTMPLTPRKSDSNSVLSTSYKDIPLAKCQLPPTPDRTPQLPSRSLKRPMPTDSEASPSAKGRLAPTSPSAGRSTKRPATQSSAAPYLFPPSPSPSISANTTTTSHLPSSSSSSITTTDPKPGRTFKSSPFRRPNLNTAKKPPSISALEFQRAAESILRQVSWGEVARYVAANRGEGVYRRVLEGLLGEKVGALEEGEDGD